MEHASACSEDAPVIVKKYSNRRLYNTASSSYITLEELAVLIRKGFEIKVIDAKSKKDLTRSVLTQIILEHENRSDTLLPSDFMKHLITFYGGNMQSVVPMYLQRTMEILCEHQSRLKDMIETATPEHMKGALDHLAKQNMLFFEQALTATTSAPWQTQPPINSTDKTLEDIKAQLEQLEKQINGLAQ